MAEQAARCPSALLHLSCLLTHLSAAEMEYVWYWLDDSKQWIEYGKEHPDHVTATVTSAFLENEYLADKNGVIFFRAGSQKYKLDFADMIQTNLLFQTQRSVIRLPKQPEGGQDGSQNMTLSHPVYPPQWDKTALPDIGFKLIQLSYDSQEYRKIKSLFEKTMKNYCINQLQRIQNPTLWDIFQWFVSILFHYPYCMRRVVFPDLWSSIDYVWSCQIQQSSRGEAAMYLSSQVWLVAQAYDCPKTWVSEAEASLGQSWKETGAPLSVTGLLRLHLCSFVCVEMGLLSLARCVCDSC
ncbi:protein mono-ADP-ribosyltransferase PARP12-like isoform X3 [Poecile atricapillus]|uniref:protein mono-ADP-ribosyltransferase PARP12-like isoform X3 n=1 Tax=Poecile atricapillus TaxID=48891 RepID=UPI002738F42E|nr:protein mono-ADP-ribosyltransferase PARP12-like isoform X3 [Poecile atricapillus]